MEGLEKVQEGRFPPFDVLTGYALRLRQPVRQSDTAQPAVLEDLLGRIGAYADTEVMNDALRTPGLHSGTQEARHTYAVREHSSTESGIGQRRWRRWRQWRIGEPEWGRIALSHRGLTPF